jgi:hypothetical protein
MRFPSRAPLHALGDAMNSKQFAAWQAKRIGAAIGPGFSYLVRLRARMEKVGFPSNDPIFKLVVKAEDAMHRLTVAMHYESCESGVGRADKEE